MAKIELDLEPLDNWLSNKRWPILIAGPCSAESEDQMVATARELVKIGKVSAFRAGIWKPRTRPGMFEGVGEVGLKWLQTVKKETGMRTATEVATAEHVELCLKYDVDVLWVGARTTVNPFSVQNVADALRGTDKMVMVKNPINPDLQLWIGGLERLNKVGIKKLAAIHRGFSSFHESIFRNDPLWQLPIELKKLFPNLPIICDPSHITGARELISLVSQKALDLDFDGLMIESHIHPQVALSDAKQQVTPTALDKIILDLKLRDTSSPNPDFVDHLTDLRKQIDVIDDEILQKLAQRMKIAAKIGEYKRDNNVTILQLSRWKEILEHHISVGRLMGLDEHFTKKFLELIHDESINIQNTIMNKTEEVK